MLSRFKNLKDKEQKQAESALLPELWEKTQQKGWQEVQQNKKNKNLIAWFSACSPAYAWTPLKDFQMDFLEGLKSFKIFKQQKTKWQKLPARRVYLKAVRPSALYKKMEIFFFKKEECFYVFNFSSRQNKISRADQKTFHQFIKGFKAP